MKKIPTLFARNPEDRRYVVPEISSGCEWVIEGLGTPRRKFDGTCVMLDEHGRWWARRAVKAGQSEPPYFVAAEHDEVTGKTVGWIPMGYSSFSRWHAEAVERIESIGGDERHIPWTAGTFELVGPKVNGNPERLAEHRLIRHSTAAEVAVPELTFDGIRKAVLALADADGCEGIVWHRGDGRMAKIKARDFPR